MMEQLGYDFFHRDCLEVAPDLVGKLLVQDTPQGKRCLRISETEAYRGQEDTACHAHKGRTKRTEVLYGKAGTLYVYLCYGMHWLLNVVTGEEEQTQAVLIRACVEANGPGKLTKALQITGAINGKSIENSTLQIVDDGMEVSVACKKRVGIGYASEEDQNRLWRFVGNIE